MIDIQDCKVKGYQGHEVSYTLMKGRTMTKKLAILLPGADYSNQKPLFHYITTMCMSQYIDVLQIHYCYDQAKYKISSQEELIQALRYDVKTVIAEVIKDGLYSDYQFFCKSLGSMALSTILDQEEFTGAKLIWLTPLLKNDDVFRTMVNCSQRSLSIIGNGDPNYNEKRFNIVKAKQHMTAKLINGTDQYLEPINNNMFDSLNILKKILAEITNFVDETDAS